MAEEKERQQPEKAAETGGTPAPPGQPKAAMPKPPPKPAVPPKPKGPVPEPWSHPLVDAIQERFSSQVVEAYAFIGQNQLVLKKDRIVEVMSFIRHNDVLAFDFLTDETATHWPKEEEFEVVYHLFSFSTKQRLRVKVRIKEWEEIESLTSVWPGADWLEREVYDMFGIRFANHPNLQRILLPDGWAGYPLRKDYDIRLQDVEWVREHLGIDSGQKFYVGPARHERGDYTTPTD